MIKLTQLRLQDSKEGKPESLKYSSVMVNEGMITFCERGMVKITDTVIIGLPHEIEATRIHFSSPVFQGEHPLYVRETPEEILKGHGKSTHKVV